MMLEMVHDDVVTPKKRWISNLRNDIINKFSKSKLWQRKVILQRYLAYNKKEVVYD